MKIGLQIPRFTWPGGDASLANTFAEITPLETFGKEIIPAVAAF